MYDMKHAPRDGTKILVLTVGAMQVEWEAVYYFKYKTRYDEYTGYWTNGCGESAFGDEYCKGWLPVSVLNTEMEEYNSTGEIA